MSVLRFIAFIHSSTKKKLIARSTAAAFSLPVNLQLKFTSVPDGNIYVEVKLDDLTQGKLGKGFLNFRSFSYNLSVLFCPDRLTEWTQ